MQCPKCRNIDLKPTRMEEGLPVMGCPECEGSLLTLLYYRDWAERNQSIGESEEVDTDVTVESDAKTALCCPKCSKIMTKYSISSDHKNRIDLCSFCNEAWLDGSEWTLLKSLELAHTLPKVFTDQWQRSVRGARMESMKVERLKRIVGEDDAAKALEVRDWLKNHEKKSPIVQFIGSD